MAAGDGSVKYQQALDLERLMIAQWGEDFRNKSLVGPLGSFWLGGVFDECGLQDPHPPTPPSSGAYGLWQILPYHPRDNDD